MARRARGFELRVVYTQRRRAETDLADHRELDELLAEADIVTLHAPLTPQTRGLIDARRLALLRDGACFVNTVTRRDRRRGGARDGTGLGTHPRRPRRLRARAARTRGTPVPANVVLTPHLGSGTRQTREAMTRIVVDNVLALERGEEPLTPVRSG